MRGRAFGLLAAVALLAACGSPPVAAAPTPPPLPRGFTLTTDAGLGFQIALAPGWTQSARDPQSGVVYAGPSGAELLVHVEQASSPRLDVAAIPLIAELTGGDALAGATTSPARLAGLTAQRTAGRFAMNGQPLALAAYVAVEGPRVWAVALVGPPPVVGGLTPAWQKMAATFQLAGARPTPPPRLSVGLPAPGFPALDRAQGPVVISFFATWCADCRTDMPAIAAAARRTHGLTLIGVDCCGDQGSSVPAFLAGLGVQGQFRNVVRDDDGAIARSYALLGPPTTAFLDGHHVLRRLVVGPVTTSSLTEGLAAIGAS